MRTLAATWRRLSSLLQLALFLIFVDLLHVAVNMGWRITGLFGVIEDGGEMVAVSLMAAYVFLLNSRDGDIRSPSPARR